MSRPFAVIGFTALCTLALLFFLPEWCVFLALGVLALAFVILLLMRRRGAYLAAVSSALLACLLMLAQLGQSYYPALQSTGEHLALRAVITSNAAQQYGRYYYTVKTISVNGEAKRQTLRLSSPTPVYAEPYDEIAFTGTVFMLGKDDPDMARSYKAKGVYLGCYAESRDEDRFEVIPRPRAFHPMKPILQLQRWMLRRLQALYPDDEAALFRGMLIGDVAGLRWAIEQDFRITGIWHVFSVSGMHVSILAWALLKLLLALKIKRRPAAVASALFVVFFMALTGFVPSCLRAGLMMLAVLAGELFSRRADSLNSLGLAALILCVISPLSAGQIGMQLSFGATLGMILFADRFAAPLKRLSKSKVLRFFNEGFATTASALALTIPLSLLHLPGGASLLAFPANLVTMALGSAAMILPGVSVFLPLKPLVWFTGLIGKAFLQCVHWIAGWPAPMLRGSAPVLALAFALCALVACVALVLRYMRKPILLRYSSAIICAVMLLGCWLPGFLTRNEITVTKLETGQGSSWLVAQGAGAALLGCDGDELPARAAKQALSNLGIRELQLFLVPGKDSGAAEICRDVPIAQLIDHPAPGLSRVTLWDDLTALLYIDESNQACLLEWNGEILVFGGEPPWP